MFANTLHPLPRLPWQIRDTALWLTLRWFANASWVRVPRFFLNSLGNLSDIDSISYAYQHTNYTPFHAICQGIIVKPSLKNSNRSHIRYANCQKCGIIV